MGRGTNKSQQIEIHNLLEFEKYKSDINGLRSVKVVGNTSCVKSHHPTIQIMMDRWFRDSLPGRRTLNDSERIALCIEGGGMRGSVTAGACSALGFLGLDDSVDVVYGSSAGAMIGAYFISKQHDAIEIYYGKYSILYV